MVIPLLVEDVGIKVEKVVMGVEIEEVVEMVLVEVKMKVVKIKDVKVVSHN